MKFSQSPPAAGRRGVALVIALAFVVLLTGLMVAFFSRALADRQVSNGSASLTKATLLAEGAVDQIIGDLKQEIAAGSTGTSLPYIPKSPASFLPALVASSGSGGFENLVKLSRSGSAFYPATASYSGIGPVRASAIPTTGTSLNGRYMTAARWNKPILMPITSGSDFTPKTSGSFIPPDWILVARNGTTPVQSSITSPTDIRWSGTASSTVVGRYAYAIYDEGGLLDANVAGYPTTSGTNQIGYKPALAYADFKQLTGSSGNQLLSNTQINQLVGWRNYSSGQGSGSLSASNIVMSGSAYYASVISNTTGFLTISSTALCSNGILSGTGQSDRMFAGRQELIYFLQNGLGVSGSSLNVLNYLATFTRDYNQPSVVPTTDPTAPKVLSATNGGNNAAGLNLDDKINPSFLAVRVLHSGTRSDGSAAIIGEPLVKKRFALNRLAWLTYSGPSAERTNFTDPDLQALMQNGITHDFLLQGTRENIRKYFGLNWDGARWLYNVHNGAKGSGTSGAIMQLGNIAALDPSQQGTPHEPDFFELLKATIKVGSLGKALLNSQTALAAPAGAVTAEVPENYYYSIQSSVDYQVMQIGANIIDQFDTDGYPTRIVFDDGSTLGPREFQGVENLPYLYTIINGILQAVAPKPTSGDSNGNPVLTSDATYGTLTGPGLGAYMQLPVLWNPHDINSSLGFPRPLYFRAVMDTTTPDNAQDSGNSSYKKIFVYAASSNVIQTGPYSNNSTTTNSKLGNPEYSFNADPSSPSSNAGTGSLAYIGSSDGSTLARTIYGDISALTFQVPNAALFREPTVLMRGGFPSGSNLALDTNHLLRTDTAVSGRVTAQGLKSAYADAAHMPNGSNLDPVDSQFVGFYLGAFPLRWIKKGSDGNLYTLSSSAGGVYCARYNAGSAGGVPNADYFTYRLEYSTSAGGPWVTYDTKYGLTSGPSSLCTDIGGGGLINGYSNRFWPGGGGAFGYYASAVDPRTSRFGLFRQECWKGDGFGKSINAKLWNNDDLRTSPGWVDTTNRILLTMSPDGNAGWFFSGYDAYKNIAAVAGWNINTQVMPAAWYGNSVVMKPGLLQQNNTDARSYQMKFYSDGQGGAGNGGAGYYYADPDGVVRRAMGAWVAPGTSNSPTCSNAGKLPPADTTVGLPIARASGFSGSGVPASGNYSPTIQPNSSIPANPTNQAQSRPYILNRPFRSVGELGYVFRDTPWKNLDFFTPESGDLAMLDVFCLNDTSDPNGLAAGKVNLNTRQQPVLKAILAGAYLDDAQVAMSGSTTISGTLTLSGAVADGIATALKTRTTGTAYGPLANLSELVGKWSGTQAIVSIDPADPNVAGPNLALKNGFIDGKLSYTGFTGGWDASTHQPLTASPPIDLVSVYNSVYASNGNHNGLKETAINIQRFHEAPIRALANAGQTRVWNLLIDVIAQTGRYPQTATTLDKGYVVEGEQRYWVHLAIDRYTGQVLDKQIEIVKE